MLRTVDKSEPGERVEVRERSRYADDKRIDALARPRIAPCPRRTRTRPPCFAWCQTLTSWWSSAPASRILSGRSRSGPIARPG